MTSLLRVAGAKGLVLGGGVGVQVGLEHLPADGGAQEVLWAVWEASGLAGEWQAVSAAGGTRGANAGAGPDAGGAPFDAGAQHDLEEYHGRNTGEDPIRIENSATTHTVLSLAAGEAGHYGYRS